MLNRRGLVRLGEGIWGTAAVLRYSLIYVCRLECSVGTDTAFSDALKKADLSADAFYNTDKMIRLCLFIDFLLRVVKVEPR